jgi:hypothetical protein
LNTHVSEAYITTGLVTVLHSWLIACLFILVLETREMVYKFESGHTNTDSIMMSEACLFAIARRKNHYK